MTFWWSLIISILVPVTHYLCTTFRPYDIGGLGALMASNPRGSIGAGLVEIVVATMPLGARSFIACSRRHHKSALRLIPLTLLGLFRVFGVLNTRSDYKVGTLNYSPGYCGTDSDTASNRNHDDQRSQNNVTAGA